TTFVIVVLVVVVSPFSPFFLLQRADGRITRIEEYLDIESMSSPSETLGLNDSLTHMTQDQDDHHDSSSSSSEDDEDVIRPKHSASRRDPQSKTQVPPTSFDSYIPDKAKGKGEEKERYTELLHTCISARDSQFCSRAKRKQLTNATFQNGIDGEFKGTVRRRPKSITSSNTRTIGLRHCHGYRAAPPAVEPSRPSELNGSRKGYIHLRAQTRSADLPLPLIGPLIATITTTISRFLFCRQIRQVSTYHTQRRQEPVYRGAPINLSNDDNPSPCSKAKRGNNSRETSKSSPKRSCSNEDDGSPTKPAWWTSQKRNNGRFSR
ncbi:hypothetical protein D6D28_06036, partial [Aureobasidium pullulans]